MKIAVCLCVKNEQGRLLEWMVHHTLIGFDTIFILDNLSDDNTRQEASAYARHHDVRTVLWSDLTPRSQLNSYEYVLHQHGREFDWIAFIDSDEFFMPLKHGSMHRFLESVGDHDAIGVNWAIYGSSGHDAAPSGLVLENFQHRAPDDISPNRHIKSVVRPGRAMSSINAHLFHLRGETIAESGIYRSDYVDCSGKKIVWAELPSVMAATPDLSICRVNHYFTRAREDWNKKLVRGWRDLERGAGDFDYHDRNEVFDDSATPFAEAVKMRLRAILHRETIAASA